MSMAHSSLDIEGMRRFIRSSGGRCTFGEFTRRFEGKKTQTLEAHFQFETKAGVDYIALSVSHENEEQTQECEPRIPVRQTNLDVNVSLNIILCKSVWGYTLSCVPMATL